ncbi:hypothetical protein M3Y99_01100800 [Aphelenchoides fujianensis]|nr:hypothetical protein M3Y99_01100800 [Aphelenchoides fujianensis]
MTKKAAISLIPMADLGTDRPPTPEATRGKCPECLRFVLTPATHLIDRLLTPKSDEPTDGAKIGGFHVVCLLRLLVIPLLFAVVGYSEVVLSEVVMLKNELLRTPGQSDGMAAILGAWKKNSFSFRCLLYDVAALVLIVWLLVAAALKKPLLLLPLQWAGIVSLFVVVRRAFWEHYVRIQNEVNSLANMEIIKVDLRALRGTHYAFPALSVAYQYAPLIHVGIELLTCGLLFSFVLLVERAMLHWGYGRMIDAAFASVRSKLARSSRRRRP